MTDNGSDDKNKESNMKIVDFSAKSKERKQLPSVIVEKIELLAKKAREGKITSIIFSADWENEQESDDVDEENGVVCLWNYSRNIRELIGSIVYLQHLASEIMLLGLDGSSEE